jgi:hypothetical protein
MTHTSFAFGMLYYDLLHLRALMVGRRSLGEYFYTQAQLNVVLWPDQQIVAAIGTDRQRH